MTRFLPQKSRQILDMRRMRKKGKLMPHGFRILNKHQKIWIWIIEINEKLSKKSSSHPTPKINPTSPTMVPKNISFQIRQRLASLNSSSLMKSSARWYYKPMPRRIDTSRGYRNPMTKRINTWRGLYSRIGRIPTS